MADKDSPPPEAMRKGMKGGTVALVVIIMLLLGFGGGWFVRGIYAPGGEEGPSKIIVGTNTPFPPFESRNDTTDEIEGFDIDLITEILDRMGLARGTDWELWDFRDFTGGLLAAVQAGRVDIAVSAITITDARNATMDFTDSYFESDQGVLVRNSDTTVWCVDVDDCQASDIDTAGGASYTVAVQTGTTSDCWVTLDCWGEENLPNATVLRYPDVADAITALQTNAADLVIIDRPAADGIADANPNQYKVAGTIQTNEFYGFAVANNDPLGLIPQMNAALAAIRADLTYDQILDKWF